MHFLFRISQTFLLVPNFHWIIVEDSEIKTPLVAKLLAQSGITYTHLNAETPKEWKLLLNVNWNFFNWIFIIRDVLPPVSHILRFVGSSMEETPRSEAKEHGSAMASR